MLTLTLQCRLTEEADVEDIKGGEGEGDMAEEGMMTIEGEGEGEEGSGGGEGMRRVATLQCEKIGCSLSFFFPLSPVVLYLLLVWRCSA